MKKQGIGLYLFVSALLICDIAVHCVRAQPAQSRVSPDLRTRQLEIVDSAGKVTARIDNGPDGAPEMMMYDQRGNMRYRITANNDFAALALYNAQNQREVMLAGIDHPLIAVYSHDRLQADLYSSPDGDSGVAVLDGKGNKRASLAYHPSDDSARIVATDSQESAELSCDSGAAVVSVDDSNSIRRMMMMYTRVGVPIMVVNDKQGNHVWAGPDLSKVGSNTPATGLNRAGGPGDQK